MRLNVLQYNCTAGFMLYFFDSVDKVTIVSPVIFGYIQTSVKIQCHFPLICNYI